MSVAVVGGAGFVGSNLVSALTESGAKSVQVIDNLLSAERENIPDHPSVSFIKGSIAEDKVLAQVAEDVEVVFHLATYHGNQNSMHDPLADHENNTLTTLKLLDHLRNKQALRKVVYSSAGCTVAKKTYEQTDPTAEDASVSLYLDTPYQISKIVGEFYANYYHMRHDLPVVKARFQNVYGPGEVLGAGDWRGTSATVWRNVVPTFVYRAIRGLALPVENGGVATRDFIFVDDIVRGLMLCATHGEPGEVYNLASGVETSILDLAHQINELAGNSTPIALAPQRVWDRSGRRSGSTAKSRDTIGFDAVIPLDEGLGETIAWTHANLSWIERSMTKHLSRMPSNDVLHTLFETGRRDSGEQ